MPNSIEDFGGSIGYFLNVPNDKSEMVKLNLLVTKGLKNEITSRNVIRRVDNTRKMDGYQTTNGVRLEKTKTNR